MTAIRARFFPAAVVLPGEPRPWSGASVLAASDGLYVFCSPGEVADWHARINWAATGDPPRRWAARNGWSITLVDGTIAVVTASGGCGCGSPLRRWAGPTWANTETELVGR